jgi:hypothetical protein
MLSDAVWRCMRPLFVENLMILRQFMVILIRLHRNDYVVPATSPNNKL